MKYAIFMVFRYSPRGGIIDCQGQRDTFEEAEQVVNDTFSALNATSMYPNAKQYSAQIASVSDDGIVPLVAFEQGEWNNLDRTISLDDRFDPLMIIKSEERWKESEDSWQKEKIKKLEIGQSYANLFSAIDRNDQEQIHALTVKIQELEGIAHVQLLKFETEI